MAVQRPSSEDMLLLAPTQERGGKWFFLMVLVLLGFVLFGAYAWYTQLKIGLGVTGMNRPVVWGFYITNFVFFIGISHAGTLISAILRLCNAEWRRPITRCAEVITVVVLFIGVANVLIDIGRPDRALFIIQHGHLRSPLLWDVVSVTAYLICSSVYLYLPLIPDIAILRDYGTRRRWFYRILALGWQGTEKQKRILNVFIGIMAVVVIPVAVSVHTVVSWVFGMTVQPMWHSTIFGPYFVCGAIFSGIAALIITMAVLRRAYHLEEFLKPIHFNYLGLLLLVMTLLWFYFTFAEYLTTYYGGDPFHMAVFWEKISGRYAFFFWTMVVTCFVIPLSILSRAKTRTIGWTVVACISVTIGMWLERFTIVVPTLVNPRLPYERGFYNPTWVEWALMLACFAGFTLAYVIFSRLFPIISVWEIEEGRTEGFEEAVDRIRSYLPSAESTARP